MVPRIKIRKVATPGSYHEVSKVKKRKEKKKGRPAAKARKPSKRKDNYMSRYTPEQLERAVDLVKNDDWSVAAAARECNVPRITLHDRIHAKHVTGAPGRTTELSKGEEDALVDVCLVLGDYNYPVTKRYLADMVKSYLDRKREVPRFKGNRPGRKWVRGFLKRHADRLVIRKPSNIKRSRAAVSPDQIRNVIVLSMV